MFKNDVRNLTTPANDIYSGTTTEQCSLNEDFSVAAWLQRGSTQQEQTGIFNCDLSCAPLLEDKQPFKNKIQKNYKTFDGSRFHLYKFVAFVVLMFF